MKNEFWHSIDTQTPVVVLYRGEKGALGVARTLGRLGVRMYLVTPQGSSRAQRSRYSVVERSRYWRELFFYDNDEGPQALLACMLDVAKRIGSKPVLLTLSDWAAIFIERHADALQEHYIFSRTRIPVIERLANKWDMFVIARELGIATPETIYPKTIGEVQDFLRTASLPVVMKTADGSLPYIPQKAILQTEEDAIAKWERDAAQGPPNLILQEYVPGDVSSVWMCNAYFTHDSRCLALFTGKKLRQVSDTGVASIAVCVQNDSVAAATRQLMEGAGYAGPVGIGYRYDARDGKYKLLDINARVSGVFRLFSSPNGADVVRICYLDLTGQTVPTSSLIEGRKWMLEDDIASAYAAMRAGTLSIGQWIASMRGVRELHWFAADDLAPGFAWLGERLVRPAWYDARKMVRRQVLRRAQ